MAAKFAAVKVSVHAFLEPTMLSTGNTVQCMHQRMLSSPAHCSPVRVLHRLNSIMTTMTRQASCAARPLMPVLVLGDAVNAHAIAMVDEQAPAYSCCTDKYLDAG